ncbi:MAG: citrate synthase [Planctomycetota bacterium]|nr:citrate synthase [Planctomycetota bacterium]
MGVATLQEARTASTAERPRTGQTARLVLDGKTYELPIVVGTENEKAIDTSQLRAETGYITLDNGFGNTGACQSRITFIDGEKGILRYRGIPIEELAEKSTFTETAHLIMYGELPTKTQLERFSKRLNCSSLIHEDMLHFFTGFPKDAHPMAILTTVVASLSAFYPVPEQLDEPAEEQVIANLMSQIRTIAAFSYKKSIGEPIVYPSNKLRFVENFLTMMFSSPVKDYHLDPDIVRAVDVFFLLHADHEQNCSTSTVRLAGSSLGNIYAVVSAGICALWGKLHGGANQEVVNMLQYIRRNGCSPEEFVARAKDKKERLMGFGHRVYRTFDPRARIIKQICHKLLNKRGVSDPCFDIALKLEEIALKDDYFLSRHLYPNVDFYSGLILKAAGFPTNMFTVLFAIGRMPGWLAQWREMHHDPGFKIARPRQIYQGPTLRHYVPVSERV